MKKKESTRRKLRYVSALFVLVMFGSSFLSSCKEEYDYTVDVANPTVVSFNPVSGTEDLSKSSNLVITFSEYVKKGNGDIVIACETDTQTINVNSDAVVISDDKRVMTVNPSDFTPDKTYTVALPQGIVTDLLGNKYMGAVSGNWTFRTRKENSLFIMSYSPDKGNKNASLFKFSLAFSDKISKGTSGNISIHKLNNGEKVAELPVTSPQVVINGNVLNFKLDNLLDFATGYYVNLDAGAILDSDGNQFDGISGNEAWTFTTTSGSSTNLMVYLPFDEDFSDKSGNKFDATLGAKATADVEIVSDATHGNVAKFNAGSYAVLPKHSLLRPTTSQSFSVNLWVKLVGIGSDPALFGNKDWDSGSKPGIVLCTNKGDVYAPNTPTSQGSGWQVNMNGNDAGSTRVDWKASSASPQAPSISDNKWHMVTIVLDQSNKRLHVFVDAVEYISSTSSTYDLNTLKGSMWDTTNDYPFTLWEDGTGGYNSGSDTRKTLSGMMDELRIYNKALTADDVASLYRY